MSEVDLTESLEGHVESSHDAVPVAFRPPMASDGNFVFNSWLRSHRDEAECSFMTNDVYYARQADRVRRVLKRAGVIVACNPEDSGQIFGFICFEPGIAHYVYVKYPFRKFGIARHLVERALGRVGDSPIVATHTGRCWHSVKARYRLTFDPRPLEQA